MKILDVTALIINVGPIDPIIKALDNTIKTISGYFDFKHYVIITDKDINHDRYEIKKCPRLNREQYNLFCIRDLWKYVKTSQFLMLHTDGFIIHPELWNDEWLTYDYIAAPWPDGTIGGGGFSLRSIKLASHVSQKFGHLNVLGLHEDGYYSNKYNAEILFKYPTTIEALKFAQETLFDKNIIPFGIHNPKVAPYEAYNYWLNTLNK